jgi:SAM-dependent methyltransferase
MDNKGPIREQYGKVARQDASCCGSPGDAALAMGYQPEDLDALPEGANLGLGCGNPTALAALRPGETVADLGSGAGIDCLLAARRVGPTGRVIGIDMTDEMIARAQENAARAGLGNVEFHQGEIEALPLPDASVDVVLSNCVLALVPDKARAFREIARVLRPGGRLAISDIVLERPLPPALRGHAGAECLGGALPRAEYLQLIQAAGLVEVRVAAAVDASGVLLAGAGPVSELARSCCGSDSLEGIATSIHVAARRPEGGSRVSGATGQGWRK